MSTLESINVDKNVVTESTLKLNNNVDKNVVAESTLKPKNNVVTIAIIEPTNVNDNVVTASTIQPKKNVESVITGSTYDPIDVGKNVFVISTIQPKKNVITVPAPEPKSDVNENIVTVSTVEQKNDIKNVFKVSITETGISHVVANAPITIGESEIADTTLETQTDNDSVVTSSSLEPMIIDKNVVIVAATSGTSFGRNLSSTTDGEVTNFDFTFTPFF